MVNYAYIIIITIIIFIIKIFVAFNLKKNLLQKHSKVSEKLNEIYLTTVPLY